MRYLSVCSGIEAATSAWHHMGWKPEAFAEIEPFPSAVLKHHYPTVPNLGDMSKFKEWNLGAIDLLVGGTPCQSFSVAGLRKGLDDPRGNLMLTFGAIARHFAPRWLVWENVPGVLSSNGGRDFGTFLGMLGELGYGFAYRVLDAQYFGVAQRRRRVFVVGCLGDWRAAAAVLFELASLSGNPPPSREKGQGSASSSSPSPEYGGSDKECADTVTSKWAKGSGGPAGNECGLFVAQAIPFGVAEQQNVGHCLRAGASKADKHESTTYVAQPVGVPDVMSTLLSSTAGVSRPGNAATEHETYIPMVQSVVGALACNTGPNGHDAGNFACNQAVDAGHVIAQPLNIYGGNKRSDRPEGGFYVRMDEDTSKTLDAASGLNPTANQGGTAVMQTVAYTTKLHNTTSNNAGKFFKERTTCLDANSPPPALVTSMAVRRLTPRECERLQGFPDDHTLIPWRGKDASLCPDGPRYKALGNSMAVPVMRWIGERIRMVCELQK